MIRKNYEEADWKEGDGRRFEAIGQVDARRGSYGGWRDPQAYAHRDEWYVHCVLAHGTQSPERACLI